MQTVREWSEPHIKHLFKLTKQDCSPREMRRACQRVIRARNAAVRQRLEMDRAFRKLYDMMEACGCDVCRHDGEDKNMLSENEYMTPSTTTAKMTKTTATSTDPGDTHENDDDDISGVDREHEHEFIHNRDVERHCNEGTEVIVFDKTGIHQGTKSLFVKPVLNCSECVRIRALVDSLDKAIVELKQVLRSLNDLIISSGRHV